MDNYTLPRWDAPAASSAGPEQRISRLRVPRPQPSLQLDQLPTSQWHPTVSKHTWGQDHRDQILRMWWRGVIWCQKHPSDDLTHSDTPSQNSIKIAPHRHREILSFRGSKMQPIYLCFFVGSTTFTALRWTKRNDRRKPISARRFQLISCCKAMPVFFNRSSWPFSHLHGWDLIYFHICPC